MSEKKEKQIEDYKQTKPIQLDLFQTNPLADDHKKYCNLMEFYDLIPKYSVYTSKRKLGKFLETIERRFVFNGKEYQLSLQPARIKTKEGEKDFFPGKREQLIEDALRKIAMESGDECMFFDGMVGLKFTMNQLRKELKNMGCSSSLNEIKQSLEICASSILKIRPTNGEGDDFTFISPLFQTVIICSLSQYKHGQRYCFVRFHPLVTRSITKKAFRLYDYKKGMKLKGLLSNYLYKRLSYNFIQAALGEPFTINLTTLIRDAGLDFQCPLWKNLDKVKLAVQELIKNEIIRTIEYEQKKESRKLLDVKIMLWVTDEFISKMMKSNFVSRELKTNPNPKKL